MGSGNLVVDGSGVCSGVGMYMSESSSLNSWEKARIVVVRIQLYKSEM